MSNHDWLDEVLPDSQEGEHWLGQLSTNRARQAIIKEIERIEREARLDEASKALVTMLIEDRVAMGKRQRKRMSELSRPGNGTSYGVGV